MGKKSTTNGASEPRSESLSAFFRRAYEAHPEWVWMDTNAPMLAYWKETHNGTEMDKSVRSVMGNQKTQARKRVSPPAGTVVPPHRGGRKASRKSASNPRGDLEQLEIMIDSCLSAARSLEGQNLNDVIDHLRSARNRIVMLSAKAN